MNNLLRGYQPSLSLNKSPIRPQFLGELEFGGYPEIPMIICSHCYLLGVDSKMGRSLFINMRPVCPVYRHYLTAYIYVYIYTYFLISINILIINRLVQRSRIIIGAHTHTSRPGENPSLGTGYPGRMQRQAKTSCPSKQRRTSFIRHHFIAFENANTSSVLLQQLTFLCTTPQKSNKQTNIMALLGRDAFK